MNLEKINDNKQKEIHNNLKTIKILEQKDDTI